MAPGASGVILVAIGFAIGVAGILPLVAAFLLSEAGRLKPSIGVGIAALVLSCGIFLIVGSAIWITVPDAFLTIAVGMVVGYFALLALMAIRSLKRR